VSPSVTPRPEAGAGEAAFTDPGVGVKPATGQVRLRPCTAGSACS